MGIYDDIIDLPHHTSPTRPRMSILERAAQFSAFQALSGYDAAIKETGRLTDERVELDEDAVNILDMKFQMIIENLQEEPEVSITYFKPDERKEGGAYETVTKKVKKINDFDRIIIFTDGTAIPMDDIVNIESRLF